MFVFRGGLCHLTARQ